MTQISLTTRGDLPGWEVDGDEIKAYLRRIGLAAQRHMGRGMAMSRGGRLYTEEIRSKRGSRGYNRPIFGIGVPRTPHIASAPGAYPAVDTGRLRMQTTNPAALDISGVSPVWTLVWGTPTPYSKWLAPADEGGEVSGPGRGYPHGKRAFMRHAVDSTIERVPLPANLVRFFR